MVDSKSETWNLPVTARVDDRNRVTFVKAVADTLRLKEGDVISFVVTQINRGGA
jgi:bifunctional DNA-binding transcriptional regulator/antitoxin component of YhaV-PrlF toxin-antitoxin module